ncbi:HAD-IA family hydrolase [Actinopolyspora mortivallis]|uniref:HAD-IA family hydrolase n=1 Tax=Actinopolyspora mortivallis TaxID=33906 RepID=UPI00036AC385|nr:HAD-IA family hydrolase [Actinopolyspora mortivallis]
MWTGLSALVMDYGGVLDDPGTERPGTRAPLLVRLGELRERGVATALLSNGNSVPPEVAGAGVLDVMVLSAEVGTSKPDPAIYHLTAESLGVSPRNCVFVDDVARNVEAAVRTGMVGVLHRDVASTLDELAVLFECVELA